MKRMDIFTIQIIKPIIETAKEQANWLQYLTALSTPVLAFFGAWIARAQWKTARMKLKLDLFDKRIVVYEAVRKAFGQLMMYGKPTSELQSDYLTGIAGARWLFDKEMDEYLSVDLWSVISKLHVALTKEDSPHPLASREGLSERMELMGKINSEWQLIDSRFAPFLSLEH
jgi:hypothetical protein